MISERDKHLVDPSRVAVLVIDMHKGHLGETDPHDALCPTLLGRTIVPALESFLEQARSLAIPVIFARFTARRDFIDCKMKFWCSEKVLSGAPRFHELNVEPVPEDWWVIQPRPGDYEVTSKKRYSAFYGTDLEILLRRLGVETVVLTGIDTDVCVMSTAWDAINRDYLTFVLRDCTHCSTEEDKEAALRIMNRWVGWVMESGEFITMIRELRVEESRMGPADYALLSYVGDKILGDLRAGTAISENLVETVIDIPILDTLRANVLPSDRIMLFALLEADPQHMRRIGACLIREVIESSDLSMLLQRFEAEPDFYVRVALMYSILHKLAPERDVVIRFLDYLDSERERYEGLCEKYYSGGTPDVLKRMACETHRGKTVLYVHYLGLLGERSALETVRSLATSDDEAVAVAARGALAHIEKTMT